MIREETALKREMAPTFGGENAATMIIRRSNHDISKQTQCREIIELEMPAGEESY